MAASPGPSPDPSTASSVGGSPPGGPPEAAKTIHNEITKLKATTLNSVALAFFIGGGVAPLVGWASTGLTMVQGLLGLVWVSAGFVLHWIALSVLRGLVP